MRAQSAFGEELKEVQQVNAIDTSASLGTVDAHLDMLRPAISNYGGSVQVPPPPPLPSRGILDWQAITPQQYPLFCTCAPFSLSACVFCSCISISDIFDRCCRSHHTSTAQTDVDAVHTRSEPTGSGEESSSLCCGRMPHSAWWRRLQVVEMTGGVCTVRYDGPPPIAMGIKVCIRQPTCCLLILQWTAHAPVYLPAPPCACLAEKLPCVHCSATRAWQVATRRYDA